MVYQLLSQLHAADSAAPGQPLTPARPVYLKRKFIASVLSIRKNRPEEDLEIFETTETLTAVGERFDAVFSRLKETENIVPIDADGSIEAVAARIAEAADRIFTEDAR